MNREVLEDGSVRLTDGSCSFLYERPAPGIIVLTISGDDRGQFGTATVDEVAAEFSRATQPLKLFVDTRNATGPTRDVMETWTAWFAANHSRLDRVLILVPPESQLLHLTVSIAQHLSRTHGLIRICATIDDFHAAVEKSVPSFNARRRR